METFNTGPSGPVILLSTIKSGTRQQILNMQNTETNDLMNATQTSPIRVMFKEQDNEAIVVQVSLLPAPAPKAPSPMKASHDGWNTGISLPSMVTSTSPEYGPLGTPDPRIEHVQKSWTASTDDECQVHFSAKEGSGYFPREQHSQSPASPSEWEQQFQKDPPKGPAKRRLRTYQERKTGHAKRSCNVCFRNSCTAHKRVKVKAGYWPREGGKRESLSQCHQQAHKGMAAETQPEREGSEKTITEIYQPQIVKLLARHQMDQHRITSLEATLVRRDDRIQMSGVTLEGLRRSFVRAQEEEETLGRANAEELREKWSNL